MKNALESDLLTELLRVAPYELPDLRLFRRQVMLVQVDERKVKVGIKGQCDLYGLWRGGGHLELELKAAKGRLSDKQVAWQTFCRSWGVPHLVLQAREGEDAHEAVCRWVQEILSTRAGVIDFRCGIK